MSRARRPDPAFTNDSHGICLCEAEMKLNTASRTICFYLGAIMRGHLVVAHHGLGETGGYCGRS
jgi:hypothetical protein